MNLGTEPTNFYEVLELTPDATPQEIRSAYLRLKSSYQQDNVAHYTLISRDDTDTILKSIEEAFLVLSHPERRRSYDQSQGLIQNHSNAPAPVTPVSDNSFDMMAETTRSLQEQPTSSSPFTPSNPPEWISDIESFIKDQHEWTGHTLKRVREARRMSLDDLSDYTRISRTYLLALEEEDYNKLPATVYVRGFLQQVAKRLRLPIDLVVKSYIERMRTLAPGKF